MKSLAGPVKEKGGSSISHKRGNIERERIVGKFDRESFESLDNAIPPLRQDLFLRR